jgi:hypothetical protein
VQEYYGFLPLTAYLAVNYMDRFLSLHRLPQEDGWAMQLLAVTCLSLAAKMEETLVPSLLDLQAITPLTTVEIFRELTFVIIREKIMDERCVLTGRGHQQIRVRARDDRPDGAARPDRAELAAPVGYALHLHRLLRLQGRSRRDAHEVPHCPGHTGHSSCNA